MTPTPTFEARIAEWTGSFLRLERPGTSEPDFLFDAGKFIQATQALVPPLIAENGRLRARVGKLEGALRSAVREAEDLKLAGFGVGVRDSWLAALEDPHAP